MMSIDTLYEYAGYKLAGNLSSVLGSLGLPLILALAGLAYTVHLVAEQGSIRPLMIHVLYLILAAWLLGTTRQQDVAAPRFVVYAGQAADLLQKRMVGRINDRFLTEPFEWDRLAARVSFARILDPALDVRLASFLDSCGKTTLARAEPRHANLLRDGALPYDGPCEARRRELWQRLQQHVLTDPHHRATLEIARAKDPGKAADFVERYTDEIALRSIDEPGGPISESALVLSSLGEYSATDRSQYTGPLPAWARASMGIAGWLFGDDLANTAITGLAALSQDYEGRFASKQRLFLAITYGPHLYGLCSMIMLGLFPVAALFALLPNQWKVFVCFLQVFVSIKLWPVGWAVLSTFNQRRGAMEAFDGPERVGGTAFLGIASMYLLVPALSFLVVHLAKSATALPFAQGVPPAAGAGLGPAGPVVNVAARLGR